MQFLKLAGKRVNLLKRKLLLVEPPDDVEHIERPAAN